MLQGLQLEQEHQVLRFGDPSRPSSGLFADQPVLFLPAMVHHLIAERGKLSGQHFA